MSGSGGGATVPEAGDRRVNVQNMPNASAPQQPATGLRRPDPSANINAAPQGSTTTPSRDPHASLNDMKARQTSALDQHLSHTTYGHNGPAVLHQNNVNTPNPNNSTYHFYEGAQPSFQNSFSFENQYQQQYHPTQTRMNPAN